MRREMSMYSVKWQQIQYSSESAKDEVHEMEQHGHEDAQRHSRGEWMPGITM